MPKTALAENELALLIASIINEGGYRKVEEIVDSCHDRYRPSDSLYCTPLSPYKYFHKLIVYRDFDLHISYLACEGDSVMRADIQFKRPSHFPAPYLNRNRALVRELAKLLAQSYSTKYWDTDLGKFSVPQDKARNEDGRQIYFGAEVDFDPSAPFEEIGSECALYDEPFSSGQTNPDETKIRNDFVIMRFCRKSDIKSSS